MKANQAVYRVATVCRVLEVSGSGYYARVKQEPSVRASANAALLKAIEEVYEESDKTYGAPRISFLQTHPSAGDVHPASDTSPTTRGLDIRAGNPQRRWVEIRIAP